MQSFAFRGSLQWQLWQKGSTKRLLFGPTWRTEQEEQFLCAISCSGNKWEGRCHLYFAARPSPSEPLFVPNADRARRGHNPAVEAKFPLPPKRRKPFDHRKLPGAFAIADDLLMGLALRWIRNFSPVTKCFNLSIVWHKGVSNWFQ